MKIGRTISELAAEIERQAATKKDYVASTSILTMNENVGTPGVHLELPSHGNFSLTSIAHEQIAEHVKIPKPYYDRMLREEPALLGRNVQTWFNKYPAPRLVRTLDGHARAFLSDAYQPLDNHDFAEAVLPILAERRLKVMSCEITDKRLYLKAVDEQLFRDVPVGFKMGDGSHKIFSTCAPALILSNSEVGFGRLVVESGVYESACTNLCLFSKGGFKRTHVGAKHRLTDNLNVENLDAILSTATKRKTLEALWMQVRDVVNAVFDERVVAGRAEAFEVAAGRKIEGKVEKVIEVVAQRFLLNDGERESVLKHLIEGGNLTQYGVHAAITRSAQDAASYDRATELEYLGGKVIELPRSEWQVFAEAA